MKFDCGVGIIPENMPFPGWMYDRHGVLCRPVAISGDTETGVCVCAVFDDDGTRVIGTRAAAVTVVRRFDAPLTIVPVPEGRDPKKPDEYQPGRPMAGLRCVVVKSDGVVYETDKTSPNYGRPVADTPIVYEGKKDGN